MEENDAGAGGGHQQECWRRALDHPSRSVWQEHGKDDKDLIRWRRMTRGRRDNNSSIAGDAHLTTHPCRDGKSIGRTMGMLTGGAHASRSCAIRRVEPLQAEFQRSIRPVLQAQSVCHGLSWMLQAVRWKRALLHHGALAGAIRNGAPVVIIGLCSGGGG